MAQNLAVSGASCKIFVNGTAIGFAKGVSVSEMIDQYSVTELGDIDTVEFEAVRRSYTMTADFTFIFKKSAYQLGIVPGNGTGTKEVVQFPETTWLVYDHIRQEPVWRLEGVVPEAHTWQVTDGSVMTVALSFRLRRMFDTQGA
jgi:hypothetical protein